MNRPLPRGADLCIWIRTCPLHGGTAVRCAWRMATLEKLKAGDTLYDVHSERMGNTTMRRLVWRRVVIKSVDVDNGTVVASWNGNPARTYYGNDIRRWRLSIPKNLAEAQGLDTTKP